MDGTVTAGQEINEVKLTNTAYILNETQITGSGFVTGLPGMDFPIPMDGTVTCSSISYASEDLPAGLTLAADGTLGGILAAGTYTFTVSLTASGTTMYYGWFPHTVSVTFMQTVIIIVA